MALPQHGAELRSLDLYERVVQEMRRRHASPEEATLQREEITRELRQRGAGQDEATECENWGHLRVRRGDSLNVAGVIDVRDLHEASRYDYGHSRWP
jgi:hypothetical protein